MSFANQGALAMHLDPYQLFYFYPLRKPTEEVMAPEPGVAAAEADYRSSTSADSTNSISRPLLEDLLPAPHHMAFGA